MPNTLLRLLVVDDSRTSRELLSDQLTRQGYEVVGAESGQQALELLQAQPFDLVLLDIEMPGMNGLEVLINLRQMFPLTELPVIMISGRDQTGDMVATLQLGANDYVVKPYNFPIVLARIQTQLAVTQQRSAPALSSKSLPSFVAPAPAPAQPKSPSSVRLAPIKPPVLPRPTLSGGSGSTGSSRGSSRSGSDPQPPPTGVSKSSAASSLGYVVVPGYEIIGELGRGGMGVVYKARHICMNRLVALKVIEPSYLVHQDAVRRFYQEVQAAAQLSHPNIVMAYDAGQAGATHYLTMEYVDGTDLSKLVKKNGRLPLALAQECIRQAALGLQHAHERGLVHRDIKPSNLLVSGEWPSSNTTHQIKILDMGLALLNAPGATSGGLTQEGRWVGTPDYMSPEQAMSPHSVDIRADLYSLGCTFYFLLAGQVPFTDPAPMEKILKHNLAEPAPIEKLRPDVSPAIAAVVRRLMAKRVDQRYATPSEVAAALQ